MAIERHIEAFNDQVDVLATMDVGKLWDRYLGEFLGEWERLNRQQLSAVELEREMLAFIEALSDKPVEDLARTSSTVAYNQGRSVEIQQAGEDGRAQFVVRSEVLDQKTCDECRQWDGAVFEIGTPSYYEYMPPAKCLGGDRCRGFYVAVAGETN